MRFHDLQMNNSCVILRIFHYYRENFLKIFKVLQTELRLRNGGRFYLDDTMQWHVTDGSNYGAKKLRNQGGFQRICGTSWTQIGEDRVF